MTTLSELRAEALRVQDAIDTIIGALDPTEIDGAINWGDLLCTEVALALTDKEMRWVATVEEADPAAINLALEIQRELMAREIYGVVVRTEW